MPILRGTVSFSRFRAEAAGERPRDPKTWLAKALRTRGFVPIDKDGEEDRSAGFVELEDSDAVEFSPGSLFYGEYVLVGYRIDQLKVPAAAVKNELEKWIKVFQLENERPPSKHEKADQRALIIQQLRNRATPRSKVHDISWNLKSGQIQVWASSRTVIEEIQLSLEKTFDLRLVAAVPAALAENLGIKDDALGPTTELCWPEIEGEVRHEQA